MPMVSIQEEEGDLHVEATATADGGGGGGEDDEGEQGGGGTVQTSRAAGQGSENGSDCEVLAMCGLERTHKCKFK
jgi:hypothetical protein